MARLDMPESDYPDIRELHLFSEMADEQFMALMRAAYVQNFPPRIELVTEGDSSDFLHIVISGSVDLFSTWNGRQTSLATVCPVSTFILAATIRDAPYLMSARTLEKSRIALIPSQDVRAVFDVDQGFARAIVTELAQSYRSVIKAQKKPEAQDFGSNGLQITCCSNKGTQMTRKNSTFGSRSVGLRPCSA